MIQFIRSRKPRGQFLLITSCLIIWSLLIALFASYGYEKTWKLWGVPTLQPAFYDFRLIPGMAETLRMGLDPTLENPGDPAGRIFNYPPIWYLLSYTGLSQDDTIWLGLGSLLLFFISVFVFARGVKIADVPYMLLVLFSSAAMLLYERGNVDLLIFGLCALALPLMDASIVLSVLVVFFAALLKLFPFLGLSAFVFKGRRPFTYILLLTITPLLAYLMLTAKNTQAAWSDTERSAHIAYGVDVFARRFRPAIRYYYRAIFDQPRAPGREIDRAASLVSYLGAFLISGSIGWKGLRSAEHRSASNNSYLAAFWMGGSIYVGTFLLGSNWDYRLIFLVLTIPQLREWAQYSAKGKRWITPSVVLGLALLSCWGVSLNFYLGLPGLEVASQITSIVDEGLNWGLFAGLVFLLANSPPEWVVELFQPIHASEKSGPAN